MKILNLTVDYEEALWSDRGDDGPGHVVLRLNSAVVYRWQASQKPYDDELDAFIAEKLCRMLSQGASTP